MNMPTQSISAAAIQALHVSAAGATHTGVIRPANQDSMIVDRELDIFGVADGVGGAPGGDVASKLALDAIAKTFTTFRGFDLDLADQLSTAIELASLHVYEVALERPAIRGMSTTVAVGVLRGNELAIAHVGDSRVYRLRGGKLQLLTHDHSAASMWREHFGDDVEPPPRYRNVLTRVVGPSPSVEVDVQIVLPRPGDLYLFCTDGLWGVVNENALTSIVHEQRSLDGIAQRLIDAANARGGPDNITAVLLSFPFEDQPLSSRPTVPVRLNLSTLPPPPQSTRDP